MVIMCPASTGVWLPLQKQSMSKSRLVLHVEQAQLLGAVKGVKPSVSAEERQRYNEM